MSRMSRSRSRCSGSSYCVARIAIAQNGIFGICQEPELPGVVEVVEVDDRLPVLDLPDGDACGLQIFELLGRGGCVQHVDVRLPRFHLRLGI